MRIVLLGGQAPLSYGVVHPFHDESCQRNLQDPLVKDPLLKDVFELRRLTPPFEFYYKNAVQCIFESHVGEDNLWYDSFFKPTEDEVQSVFTLFIWASSAV